VNTKVTTIYTGSTTAPYAWTTNDYDVAVSLAGKDANRSGRLFSEIYNKVTNTIVGFASYDGKEI
jgi:hypothetical protein